MNKVNYVHLKEVCNVNQGLQIPISKRYKTAGENRYFYITIQFLKNHFDDRVYIENPNESTICTKNDILVVRTGSTGQVITGVEGCFHNNFFKVNYDKSKIDGRYLYYCLSSKEKQKEMKKRAGITTIPDLNHFMFLDMKIPLLDLESQKKISKVLDTINKKNVLNNKINQQLETMAKTLYDYWFVQFDFSDVNGKPYKSSGGKMVYSEELKREIPERWEVFSLSSILKSNYSSINKNNVYEEIEYLDTSSLTKNQIDATECLKPEIDKIPSRAKRIVNANDILYSTVRPNLCHYGIIKHPLKNMIASTGFIQLFSKISWISNDLIYTFLTSSWITDRLQQIATLSVSSYPSISPNDIFELNIALPKKGKGLEFIDTTFDSIYSKISLNQKENQKLTEQRDWLLPMLMNGQAKVGDEAEEMEDLMVAEPTVGYGKSN